MFFLKIFGQKILFIRFSIDSKLWTLLELKPCTYPVGFAFEPYESNRIESRLVNFKTSFESRFESRKSDSIQFERFESQEKFESQKFQNKIRVLMKNSNQNFRDLTKFKSRKSGFEWVCKNQSLEIKIRIWEISK